MIITISGVPGSGKTSVGKLLAARLGYRFYSVGGLRGKMAIERGLTIADLNRIGETDPSTDTTVDDYQRELGATEDDFVIEGRLSWHFIPHSFKVMLTCDARECARRVFEARRRSSEGREDEPVYESVDDALLQLDQRTASDRRRYAKFYRLDHQDPSHYDLVIDTTTKNATTVADLVETAGATRR
jgi:CMP/dCMP kinase